MNKSFFNVCKKTTDFSEFRFFVCDFDGVFTDNSVFLNSENEEFVRCSRSDGFGIKLLKEANRIGLTNLTIAIVSGEMNSVVNARGEKLDVDTYAGVQNKSEFLSKVFFPSHNVSPDIGYSKLIYLGNDLNDLNVMHNSALSFAPNDAHYLVKKAATKVFHGRSGGDGFVRSVIEEIIGSTNLVKILEKIEN